jgi:hypothetical protein
LGGSHKTAFDTSNTSDLTNIYSLGNASSPDTDTGIFSGDKIAGACHPAGATELMSTPASAPATASVRLGGWV